MSIQIQETQTAIVKLRHLLADALGGGPDPTDLPQTEALLSCLMRLQTDDEKAKAGFITSMQNKRAFSGTSRMVVLARGSRFLLGLSMWLEDTHGPFLPSCQKTKKTPSGQTPFDPALLTLKGVGPKTAARLASRGLCTINDLIYFLPRTYRDQRQVTPIGDLEPGMRVVTRGTIIATRQYGRPWKRILEVVVEQDGHTLSAMWFTNRRPSGDRFTKGAPLLLAGLISTYKGRLQIAHPQIATDPSSEAQFCRVIPIYPKVSEVPGKSVEKAVAAAVDRINETIHDPIPAQLLARHQLPELTEALRLAHHPEGLSPAELDDFVAGDSPIHRRLAYDEFFFVQLALARRRALTNKINAPVIPTTPDCAARIGQLMGVQPTDAQHRVIDEICHDIALSTPMRRLLQGDVGSGKTLVALAAIWECVMAGYQAALMAPTEILAEQHMSTLFPLLQQAGITAGLHIGAARTSARSRFLKDLHNGTIQVAIGTHALIQESVTFNRLGLAVIDEQHRFGVAQRLGLGEKGPDGLSPHLLVMTATPIPRSLALTVHGDLDVSVINERPPGRQPITTTLLAYDQTERMIEVIQQTISQGEQAYVVCPIISPSEAMDVPCAITTYEQICQALNPDLCALLHGQQSPEDRSRAMNRFITAEVKVLVSTTVIEVGVDVQNATLMIIRGAERFGMAQLHQLRGRVGRGTKASNCILMPSNEEGGANERLLTLCATQDGFVVAQKDLELRGPGDLYGKRQAGLPGFRFANLATGLPLLEAARSDVQSLRRDQSDAGRHLMTTLEEALSDRIARGDGPVGEESG